MRLKFFFLLAVIFFSLPSIHSLFASNPTLTQEQPAPAPAAPIQAPIPPPPSLEPQTSLSEPAVSYESAFIKMLVTLGGLILCVFLTIWILRRLSQGRFRGLGSNRSIQILEKRALSPKSILYLIQVGSKQVLISESQFEVRKLATLEETIEEESND